MVQDVSVPDGRSGGGRVGRCCSGQLRGVFVHQRDIVFLAKLPRGPVPLGKFLFRSARTACSSRSPEHFPCTSLFVLDTVPKACVPAAAANSTPSFAPHPYRTMAAWDER